MMETFPLSGIKFVVEVVFKAFYLRSTVSKVVKRMNNLNLTVQG